jgi:mannose-6-phosphate isomerase-like protein (cupin superfamily)
LHRSLDGVRPEDVWHFDNLATAQICRELVDPAQHYRGPEGLGAHHHTDGAGPPETLDDWAAFHEEVGALPEEERRVVELLWYEGRTHAQAADAMGVATKTVQRRWASARRLIRDALGATARSAGDRQGRPGGLAGGRVVMGSDGTAPSGARVVITPGERLDGSAMQQAGGAVRDLKLVYPETGFDAMTLCLGVVEVDPGQHTPLHRHRCEEVYYVVRGSGELESGGRHYPLSPGCAALNRPGVLHRVFNTGPEVLQLVVVAGVMLVPLLPQWPTSSPYEVFEGTTAADHPPVLGARGEATEDG